MDIRIALPVALLFALAACGKPARPDTASWPQPPGPAAKTSTVYATIHGTATYVERVKMPPGASLEVTLVDAASQSVVATTTVHDVGGPPIPFSVARATTNAPLALRAVLVGPDGQQWFETPAPVQVPPDDADVELRMRRVLGTGGTRQAPVGNVAHWECGELGVMSRFDNATRTVRLSFNGRRVTIPLARSASGARYADSDSAGKGNEFWTKGATGTLKLVGEPSRDCVLAAQPSPWNAALLRGVMFRAVGNEPGWVAEISGPPPSLDATLDYGERHVSAPLRAVAGGYEGRDAGEAIVLRVDKAPCRDGMSGQAFEATVVLRVGGKTYRGCGADLQD